MANADIVLHNDHVEIKNGRLRTNSIENHSPTRVRSSISVFSALRLVPDRKSDSPKAGLITMVNSTNRVANITLDAEDGDIKANGRITGKRGFFREKISAPEMGSTHLKLGAAANGEGVSSNGKLTMISASGDNSIVLDSKDATILIKGYGDLVEKVKQLEAKVAELENSMN